MAIPVHNVADARADLPLYAKLYAAFAKAAKPQLAQHSAYQPVEGAKLKADAIANGIDLIDVGTESIAAWNADGHQVIEIGTAMIARRDELVTGQDEAIANDVEEDSQTYAHLLTSSWLSQLRRDKEKTGSIRTGAVLPDGDPAFHQYWNEVAESLVCLPDISMTSVLSTGLAEIASQEPGDLVLPLKLTIDRGTYTLALFAMRP